MTDNGVRTYECPSPDCDFVAGGTAELGDHVNTGHPGEFRRDDWPDTPAGRAMKADRESEDDEDDLEE